MAEQQDWWLLDSARLIVVRFDRGGHRMENGKPGAGVFCPEDWIQPSRFFQALADLGVPRAEILDQPDVL